MKYLPFIFLASLSFGCISATIQEPSICKTSDIPVMYSMDPYSPIDVTLTIKYDLSSDLSTVSDLNGQVIAQLTQLSITNSNGDLSWIHTITVSISSVENTKEYPTVDFAYYQYNPSHMAGSTINLTPTLDGSTIYNYISQGAVRATVHILGYAPKKVPTISSTLCMSATIKINKNL